MFPEVHTFQRVPLFVETASRGRRVSRLREGLSFFPPGQRARTQGWHPVTAAVPIASLVSKSDIYRSLTVSSNDLVSFPKCTTQLRFHPLWFWCRCSVRSRQAPDKFQKEAEPQAAPVQCALSHGEVGLGGFILPVVLGISIFLLARENLAHATCRH
jgi:hypothetical protein